MTVTRSVLDPPAQSLALPLVLAVLLHGCTGAGLLGVHALSKLLEPDRKPLIDPADTMEVSLVQLEQTDEMPTRATVAPPPPQGDPEPAPEPQPEPVRESDLEFQTPDAEPDPGEPDRTQDREKVLEEMDRRRRLQEALAMAEQGTETREATDPDSTADRTIQTGAAGGRADPALAKYKTEVESIFMEAFEGQKLTVRRVAANNPDIQARYNVDFDPDTGEVLGQSPYEPSGNPVYDAAVERAIQSVSSIPLPPEEHRDTVGSRLTITFLPP